MKNVRIIAGDFSLAALALAAEGAMREQKVQAPASVAGTAQSSLRS